MKDFSILLLVAFFSSFGLAADADPNYQCDSTTDGVAVSFFDPDGEMDWVHPKKFMTWDEARVACQKFGEGWDLPIRADLQRARLKMRNAPCERLVKYTKNFRAMAWTLDETAVGAKTAWAVYLSTANMAGVQKQSVLPVFCGKLRE